MSEEIMTSATRKRKFPSSALVFLIVIILIVVVFALANRTDEPKETAPESQTETTEQETVTIEVTNFEGINPQDWEAFDTAMTNIQALGEGQNFSGEVIQDPTETNFYYFASFKLDGDGSEQTYLLSIYKYNLDNHNFDRIYRRTLGSNNSYIERSLAFDVVGYDSGNLVVLAHSMGVWDPCQIALGSGEQRGETFNLLSMSLENPYAGFTEYHPSQDLLDTVSECL